MGKLIVGLGMVVSMLILLFGVAHAQETRPNILLIVADDLGYSDLGSYGGEFKTPVIDQLAADGVRYTDFYVSPACATTRAMLLTGTDHHVAGLGSFENFIPPDAQGKPGYEGWMNHQVVTVASLLRDGGYHTYLAGKWHLGYLPDHSYSCRYPSWFPCGSADDGNRGSRSLRMVVAQQSSMDSPRNRRIHTAARLFLPHIKRRTAH